MSVTPYSLLDLAPVIDGGSVATALACTRDLGQHAERWGYTRYWIAEHHNMEGIASAATSIVISHVAAATSTMRVGAGGIMLPNHAPLQIAEQFGTLDALYPNRIDLGLGRAPGTDQPAMRALRRYQNSVDRFAEDVEEIGHYFRKAQPHQPVRAVPGEGANVPRWILGSSLFGAQLASELGLPYAFASHFAPEHLMEALRLYRARFRPSLEQETPYAMVAVNVFAADTETEARRLFTSLQQAFAKIRRGRPGKLPRPVDDIHSVLDAIDLGMIEHTLRYTVVGTVAQVRDGLARIQHETKADELMLTGMIYDHAARLRSFELAAEAARAL